MGFPRRYSLLLLGTENTVTQVTEASLLSSPLTQSCDPASDGRRSGKKFRLFILQLLSRTVGPQPNKAACVSAEGDGEVDLGGGGPEINI